MNVLISGASIAGPTLAYFLMQQGHDVTIVERAAQPREGGSPIDVRNQAIDVAERMGILAELQAVKCNTQGLAFLDEAGEAQSTLDVEALVAVTGHSEDPARDLEIQRDHLVNAVYAAGKADIEYVFEDSIQTIDQDEDGVDVTFTSGAPRRFDLVVGADGLHSAVRRLVFGQESQFASSLGLYVGVVDVDPSLGRRDWGLMHNTPGKLAGIYSFHDAAQAILVFRSTELTYDYHDIDEQKKLLLDEFASVTWKAPAILDAVSTTTNLYFDPVCQIRMPTWSKGRVALIGDAAHCASFLSGSGASLAMAGGAALADALAANGGDHRAAFAEYEKAHRPMVKRAVSGVKQSARMLVPGSNYGIWQRKQLFKLIPGMLAIRTRFGGRRTPERSEPK